MRFARPIVPVSGIFALVTRIVLRMGCFATVTAMAKVSARPHNAIEQNTQTHTQTHKHTHKMQVTRAPVTPLPDTGGDAVTGDADAIGDPEIIGDIEVIDVLSAGCATGIGTAADSDGDPTVTTAAGAPPTTGTDGCREHVSFQRDSTTQE